MADDPSVYNYLYALTVDGSGNFVLADANGNSGDGLTPQAEGVSVKDDIGDPGHDRHTAIGDVAGDHFDMTMPDGTVVEFSFVSVGTAFGGGGFIAQDVASGAYYYFTDTAVPSSSAGSQVTELSGVVQVCFMAGTMIRTPTGEVAIETLSIGDLVETVSGDAVPVRWVGRQTVAPRFVDELRLPVRIKAGALDENVPGRDLVVSPDHALFIDGVLVHAAALINGSTVVRERDVPMVFTYYHVEAADHALILAENTPVESFIDNVDRARFDNGAEYQVLYPDAAPMAEMPYARAKAWRQVPVAIRDRLVRRAVSFNGAAAAAA